MKTRNTFSSALMPGALVGRGGENPRSLTFQVLESLKGVTNMNRQRTWIKSGVRLIASIGILLAATLLSSTTSQAFILVTSPASQLDLFAPVNVQRGEVVSLNTAHLLGDGSVRVLFKFFDSEGNTLKEEIKTLEVGQAAAIDFTPPPIDVVGPMLVQGLVAVLSEGGGRISSRTPMSSSLELRSAPNACDGSVRTAGFLPAVQKFSFTP